MKIVLDSPLTDDSKKMENSSDIRKTLLQLFMVEILSI